MVIFLSTILFDAYFSGTSRRTGTGKGRRFDGAAAFFGVADKLELNKIAARWPAKAMAQLFFS